VCVFPIKSYKKQLNAKESMALKVVPLATLAF